MNGFKKTIRHLAILLSVFVVACGPADEEEGEDAAAEEGERPHAGTEVQIFGAFVDEDARRFEENFEEFEEETGISVTYEGSGDFESLVNVRAEGGDPPDIGMFPQPGLLRDLVEQDHIVDLDEWFDASTFEEVYSESQLEQMSWDGQKAGFWFSNNVKSLVWYAKPAFEEEGYEIPETWDEMVALSEQMVDDGYTPWSIGMESAGATGWVGTDWIEDIMLRTAGPEAYDDWVTGELPFDSPEVRRAFEILGDIWLDEEMVFGGTDSILTVPFGEAHTPLLHDPPRAMMMRQASFIPSFFPDEIEIGEEIDFFYLPQIDEDQGEPVLMAGDIVGVFEDRPEVREVVEFMLTPESTRAQIEAGNFIAAHQTAPLEWYPTDADRRMAEILRDADVVRFDASDMMPASVGTGSFWNGMVDYVSGDSLDDVLEAIDADWPDE